MNFADIGKPIIPLGAEKEMMSAYQTPRPADWTSLKAPSLRDDSTSHVSTTSKLEAVSPARPHWTPGQYGPPPPRGLTMPAQDQHQTTPIQKIGVKRDPPYLYAIPKPIRFLWADRSPAQMTAWILFPSEQYSIPIPGQLSPIQQTDRPIPWSAVDRFRLGDLEFHYRSGMLVLNSSIELGMDLPPDALLHLQFRQA